MIPLFSMEWAAKFKPGFKKINERYNELLQNITDPKCSVCSFYQDTFRNYTDLYFKKDGLNINELFDKMSVRYKRVDGNYLIDFTFVSKRGNISIPGQSSYQSRILKDSNIYNIQPLESIAVYQHSNSFDINKMKCFTFFSYAVKGFKKLPFDIVLLRI